MQAFRLGEIEVAERWLEEAVALFRQEGYRFGAAHALTNLAEIALARGDHARAAALWQEEIGQTWYATGLTRCLMGLAEIAAAIGQMQWAARLLGAAEANRELLGTTLMPRELAGYEKNVDTLRAALGEAAFVAAWAEGRRMSPDEARAEAIWVMDAIQKAPGPGRLTVQQTTLSHRGK